MSCVPKSTPTYLSSPITGSLLKQYQYLHSRSFAFFKEAKITTFPLPQSSSFITPAIFKEITTEADFNALVDCLWDAYCTPYIPFMQILFPIFADTEEGYETAVALSKASLWAQHTNDQTSHWIALEDSETGEVCAGAHWNFHKVSPFINGAPKLVATWYPEGEGRDFASHILNQIYGGRGQRLWRPHARK